MGDKGTFATDGLALLQVVSYIIHPINYRLFWGTIFGNEAWSGETDFGETIGGMTGPTMQNSPP